jgi:hypothetical protein
MSYQKIWGLSLHLLLPKRVREKYDESQKFLEIKFQLTLKNEKKK